jgi:MFS family permease
MIFFSFIAYFNYVGITGDGMNMILQGFAGEHGFDFATLLAINTPTSLVSIASTLFIGWIMNKKGVKLTIGTCYIIVGVLILLWVRATTLTAYIVIITLIFAVSVSYSHLGAAQLTNDWFVRKRSMAFGISSIGLNVCTMLFVPMLALLFGNLGFVNGFSLYAVILIGLGVVTFFWVKNKPEDIGKYIDNDPEHHEALQKERDKGEDSAGWTFKKCMKCREVHLLGIGFGLAWLVVMGVVTQIVQFYVDVGQDQSFGILMMSVSAGIGCVSSWVWGLVDIKLGTRKASIIYALYFIIPFGLLTLPPSTGTLIAASLTFGWTIGAHSTLMPSFVQGVFGRDGFAVPYKYIMTWNVLLKSFAFVILAFSLNTVGNYRLAYGIFIVIVIIMAIIFSKVKSNKRIYASDIA